MFPVRTGFWMGPLTPSPRIQSSQFLILESFSPEAGPSMKQSSHFLLIRQGYRGSAGPQSGHGPRHHGPWQQSGGWNSAPGSSTLHPTPYTLHPTPYTLQPTPCTLHPTPRASAPPPHPPPSVPPPRSPHVPCGAETWGSGPGVRFRGVWRQTLILFPQTNRVTA